jgi:hypothetical protein
MTLSKDSKLSANVHREYFTLCALIGCDPSAAPATAEKLTLVLYFFTS